MSRSILIAFILLIYPLLSLSWEATREAHIIDLSADEVITFDELTNRLIEKKIIYIGETHDNEKHHQIQLELIEKLFSINSYIAIGMEMFQARFQDDVDSYLLGHIGEEDFLERVQYAKRWGFEFDLYKPILEFAKTNKLPLLALNADSELVKEVSRNGISSLGANLLNQLPYFMDFSNQEYKNHLYDIFKEHPETKNKDFDRFYQVQLVWDETMAQNIDEFLREAPDYQLIVLTGNGHIAYNYGIPSSVYGRNHYEYATITIDLDENKGISDYLMKTSN